MDTLTEANTQFGLTLFKALIKENPKKNVFVSPFSISAAMSMVLLGAGGNTAEQMKKVLCFDKITESGSSVGAAQCDMPGGPHSQFKTLLAAINTHTKNYALSTANRLYGAEKYEFLQKFLRCTKDLYSAELERLDFEHASEESRTKINFWVEAQTNGKIRDLLPFGSIDESTILVLVNAIYFKGKWKREFKNTDTTERPFWINENQSKNVQMMHQEHEFNWAEIKNPNVKVLEMPYDQHDLSMFILLPEKGAMDQVVKDLNGAKLQQWTCSSSMRKQELKVFLPKFKLEAKYALKSTLGALGMRDLFSEGKADLSGMSKSNLVVSEVIHKAFVEVNEEGTEAAGATGVVVVVPVSVKILPEFIVNRPFIFCIRHNETKSILFCGMVASP